MSSVHDTRTHEERTIGRYQRYVHSGADPARFHANLGGSRWRKNPEPRPFRKPAGKKIKPVTGGRWGVRKLACDTANGWQWEAYCKGSLKAMTGRFPTQELAVAHAQRMAMLARLMRP